MQTLQFKYGIQYRLLINQLMIEAIPCQSGWVDRGGGALSLYGDE
jgi:hypothetical protein